MTAGSHSQGKIHKVEGSIGAKMREAAMPPLGMVHSLMVRFGVADDPAQHATVTVENSRFGFVGDFLASVGFQGMTEVKEVPLADTHQAVKAMDEARRSQIVSSDGDRVIEGQRSGASGTISIRSQGQGNTPTGSVADQFLPSGRRHDAIALPPKFAGAVAAGNVHDGGAHYAIAGARSETPAPAARAAEEPSGNAYG